MTPIKSVDPGLSLLEQSVVSYKYSTTPELVLVCQGAARRTAVLGPLKKLNKREAFVRREKNHIAIERRICRGINSVPASTLRCAAK